MIERKQIIQTQCYHAPCGELLIASFKDKLCLCDWSSRNRRDHVDRRLQAALQADCREGVSDVLQEAVRQLHEYFNGRRTAFDDPLLAVGTEFQRSVWLELREIPYGETLSYKELARRLGIPDAVRAVANANGANVLSLFIPCHRVIGSNGSLTGYAGGLDAKRWLLNWESRRCEPAQPVGYQ